MSNGNKKLWNVWHNYDVVRGYGATIPVEEVVATVWATDEEMETFLQKWNHQEVYDAINWAWCHNVSARVVEPMDISALIPYSTDPDDEFNQGIIDLEEEERERRASE